MRSALRAFAKPMVVSAFVMIGACSESSDSVRVSLGPSLALKGFLDSAEAVTITVYDVRDNTTCDIVSGRVFNASDDLRVATHDLQSDGCAAGVRFCGDFDISRSDKPRIFSAVAYGAGHVPVAQGCTTVVVNQEKLPIQIGMKRYIPPQICGGREVDGLIQCAQPGSTDDPVCDEDCHTKEVWLSIGSDISYSTKPGDSGDKIRPFLLWPSNDNLLAVWGDKTPRPQTQVALRLLDLNFGPVKASQYGSEVVKSSIFIPNEPGAAFPPQKEANNQLNPAAALLGSKYYIVFQDDSAGTIDIHLRSIVASNLNPEQGKGAPLGINGAGGAGEPGVQANPAIAVGPNGTLLIAWQDAATLGPGKIIGRIFDTTNGNLGDQIEISSGGSNQNVALAGTSTGWIAVWEDGSSGVVKMRRIGSTGTGDAEQVVSSAGRRGGQLHPTVAVGSQGRYAVAWTDMGADGGADIFVQRYTSANVPVGDDQIVAINDIMKDGEQVEPSIAAGPGFFAVTWVDRKSNHVRARFLDQSAGFLPNGVDGQTSEFQVSIAEGHPRANPTIAVGGAGPYLGIAWEDLVTLEADVTQPGIYGRRLPIPIGEQ